MRLAVELNGQLSGLGNYSRLQTPARRSLAFAASSMGDSGPMESLMMRSSVVVTGRVNQSGKDLSPIMDLYSSGSEARAE